MALPTDTALDPRSARLPALALFVAAAGAVLVQLAPLGGTKAALFAIGLALGATLYHAAFGFTGAYRRAIVERDTSGIMAQVVMLALAVVLFAPVLAEGRIGGAVAPVGVAMAFGAFLFGVGMQIAGGCASGTLFTTGGGNARMAVVLLFFCLGAFWATLDLGWWNTLPRFRSYALGREWGWPAAVAAQLALLAVIGLAAWRFGNAAARPLWWRWGGFRPAQLLTGPWPLLLGAVLLALLNWAVLVTAGHPWSVTWGFTLWGARLAQLVGWDPATSAFWSGAFQSRALAGPLLADTISLLNIGIVLGALAAAAAAGRFRPSLRIGAKGVATAVIGGLMLGYGARLAYGCNIGAFFSGVASSSLHGWAWILFAAAGNVVGVRARRWLGLDG